MVAGYDSPNAAAMPLSPVFLNLEDRDCLVVGETSHAEHYARALIAKLLARDRRDRR